MSIVACSRLSFAFLLVSAVAAAETTVVHPGDSPGDNFGSSVGAAGDVDGDGIGDVIVGAPFDDDNGNNAGRARVLSGKDGSTLWDFDGDDQLDLFGRSVDGIGDVNNDGFADVVVGAFFADQGGLFSGMARVFSGQNGQILFNFYGNSTGDQLGNDVSAAGDVNGDGFPDYIVGAWAEDVGNQDSGAAYVVSGQNGSILHSFGGTGVFDSFGGAVGGAGDVNGDGHADVIVGAYLDDDNGTDSGRATVFSGQNGAVLYAFDGTAAGDFFGLDVSGAGDVDNDGRADFMVGAPGEDNGAAEAGSVRVYSGATGALLHVLGTGVAGDEVGGAIAALGDEDGDGHDDLLVGVQFHDQGGADAGAAFVYSGATGSVLKSWFGDAADDRFGHAVSSAGDIDGDGDADIAIGASKDDPLSLGDAGSVTLISDCAGDILSYGSGCPGSAGFVPNLALTGCTLPGSTLSLKVSKGLGGSTAFLLFGFGQASIPVGGGCSVLIFPLLPVAIPLPLGGQGGVGTGNIEVSGQLPDTAPVGAVFTTQAYVIDPANPIGAAFTNAVMVTIL